MFMPEHWTDAYIGKRVTALVEVGKLSVPRRGSA
ncbi:protein of unknown function (plasmid) [Azospirillum baldaniorum]|uniref:Uncharacterized protein n=1 Tax=Azospirillum baldaniorum TaxID=1064539 RepID=A0A9P1JTS4_9PROT|nr:protein of unknown function [Azospirillum baldaniorum]